LSSPAIPFTTAGLRPELFGGARAYSLPRVLLVAAISFLVIVGFAFRINGLSSEGLSEDELNKLDAVNEYRAHGPTSANGEHPLLMKALLTVSVVTADAWDRTSLVAAHPELNVPVETSLRVPGALFGAATAILIFLVATELFGWEIGLLSAALWTFDPLALGYNRIAKEDTFLIFFFLLANYFWLRGQRAAESQTGKNPERFYWLTAIAFGAMLASKYVPLLIAITVSYNYAFQKIPVTRWVIGKKRFIKFFLVMGVAFVIFNPTILLPGTWRAMLRFSTNAMIGHDSYEFMGRLFPHKFTDWLRGEPWYFYLALMGTKLQVLPLAGFVGGMVLLFRRKTGDGRYFLLLWFAIWALGFMFVGGKFTRYILSVLPAVTMTSALGIQFVARRLGRLCAGVFNSEAIKVYASAALSSLVILIGIWSAASAAPHYRLAVNSVAARSVSPGEMFPQDEFYDAYMQQALAEIGKRAETGARVASEIPTVATFYANRAGRPDLISVELSDPAELVKLRPGDFVINARGRTYFSNQAMLVRLRQNAQPAFTVSVGAVPAAAVYVLDQKSLATLRGL
jgi:predicted membrane-bound dolichyl-phosphate-mannose-protein mannosyltransferase